MSLQYVLYELDGTRIGGVTDADERSLSLSLTGLPTASFTIPQSNPMAAEVVGRNGDVLCCVYYRNTLYLTADLTTAEEIGDANGVSLKCNFAGPLWRLSKRLTAKVPQPGFEDTAVSRAEVAVNGILATNNSEKDTGIRAGTVASLHDTSVGPWYYKPSAEAFSEMAALRLYPFEDIGTGADAGDSFTNNPGALTGRIIEHPGTPETWLFNDGDTTPDLTVSGGVATRSAGGGTRFVSATDNDYSRISVQCDFGHDQNLTAMSGVFCRAASGSVGALAYSLYSTRIQAPDWTEISVWKIVNGVQTALRQVVTAPTTTGQVRTHRLQAELDGSWFFWDFPQGTTPVFPTFSGQDDDLAVFGLIEAGRIGIHDTPGTASVIRNYDNFTAKVPTVTVQLQGFEWDLVPSVPTVDGSGVKIATLNTSARLGSDKPHAVFEYGGGARSVKGYQRIINRQNLLTQGVTLTDTDVLVAKDDTAVFNRGLYEEVVPNDLGNAGLRHALTDATVQVRKQAQHTFTFNELASRAPVFGTDYIVGDTVRVRITSQGSDLYEGTVRVQGVDISVDAEGNETVVPRLDEE